MRAAGLQAFTGAREVDSLAKSANVARSYYPDFVAIDGAGTHWILETKGQESAEVDRKDEAAARWCEDTTALTRERWRYLKVPQKEFEQLRPGAMAELTMLGGRQAWLDS